MIRSVIQYKRYNQAFVSLLNSKQNTIKPYFKFSIIQQGEDASKFIEEVEGKVLQAIKKRSPLDLDQISRTAKFGELGLDSLDAADMIVSLEESFHIDIDDYEALRIETPNDAIATFHKYLLEKYNRNKLARKKPEKALEIQREASDDEDDDEDEDDEEYHENVKRGF